MTNKRILNVIILFIIATVLFVMPVKTYAAADLGDIFGEGELEDQGESGDLKGNDQGNGQGGAQGSGQGDGQQAPGKPENEYSDAGLAEDTIMIISIVVLGTTAIYAYRKVNEYQNI